MHFLQEMILNDIKSKKSLKFQENLKIARITFIMLLKKEYIKPLFLIVCIKLILLFLFSSGYKNQLFIPFVELYLNDIFSNPWQKVFDSNLSFEFPYPPLMLWILSLFYAPIYFLPIDSYLKYPLFSLPLILADLVLFIILLKLVPNKEKEILIFYFFSPILIFSTFLHNQLDIIPISLLFVSIYFLKQKKEFLSFIFLGLAISTKTHILLVLSFYFFYMLKQHRVYSLSLSLIIPLGIFGVLVSFYLSSGFIELVLNNPKQNLVFDSYYKIGDIKVLLPLVVLFTLYVRFFSYKKVNFDLLFYFIAISFTIFLVFVKPSPGWFVWILPFMVVLIIKSKESIQLKSLFILINLVYCIYFLFFHSYEYSHLLFLKKPLEIVVLNEKLKDLTFSLLFALILFLAYVFYKSGIASNEVYKPIQAFSIGIGGDSGAGKSTLLEDLKAIFKNKLLDIEGDGYHKWERGHIKYQELTHLNPKANYLHSLAENIIALKNKEVIYKREYDHTSGKFSEPIKVEPKEFIVICGLHPFYLPITRKVIDFKIFVDTDEDLRIAWKIKRDKEERGYTQEKILSQIEARSEDAKKYIKPQKEYADLIINYHLIDNKDLALKLTFSADIEIDFLVELLEADNVISAWEYSSDLKSQYIILNKEPTFEIKKIAQEEIENISELIENIDGFKDGYRGLIQLICLKVISFKLKQGRTLEI